MRTGLRACDEHVHALTPQIVARFRFSTCSRKNVGYVRDLLWGTMQRLGFLSSIIFASGLSLGVAAPAGNMNLPGQDTPANTWPQPRAATHETRSDTLQVPNPSEVVARTST